MVTINAPNNCLRQVMSYDRDGPTSTGLRRRCVGLRMRSRETGRRFVVVTELSIVCQALALRPCTNAGTSRGESLGLASGGGP